MPASSTSATALACVFKMESHNHPELHRALPGRGDRRRRHPAGCVHHGRAADRLRSMLLRFGDPPTIRKAPAHLVSGVVAGVGGYGNSFGVPTVGGLDRASTRRYDGNILVNAMAVGLARTDAIFYAKPPPGSGTRSSISAPRPAATASTAPPWRPRSFEAEADGIEASDRAGRRPLRRETATRGLPRADEASGAVIAIQDMGAAGLTSLGGRDGRQGRSRRRARHREGALPARPA